MKVAELLSKLKDEHGFTFTRQYIQKLAKDGKIPYVEVGSKKTYVFDEVLQALQNLQQKHTGIKFEAKNKDGSLKTINSTKIMLQEYQGKLAQQKFDIEAGKLVYREDVENKAFTVARVLRNQVLALPERLAGELASTNDINEIKEILYKELNEVLEYMSSEKDLYD